MGVLLWDYPAEGEDCQRGQVISSIVQSGIKLFLHQRNQIPLPVEQLGRHILSRTEADKRFQNKELKEEEKLEEMNSQEETKRPRERIQQMISNRKRMMKATKGRNKDLRASRREELAFKIITNVLQSLNMYIINIYDNLLGVGLIFGPSIQSPKELIIFDIPLTEVDQSRKGGSCPTYPSRENFQRPLDKFHPLIRSFYRTIIMSDEFVDLTAKSLSPTGTHICLFSRVELSEEHRQDLILLESTHFLSQLLRDQNSCSTDKSQSVSVPPRRRMIKVLRMKIRQTNESVMEERREEQELSTQSDIKDRNEVLLDSNSFCCYQIPLRFKGVQCKNKR